MGEALTGLKRSCMCCDVNESMIGQEVTVMGWVQRRRGCRKRRGQHQPQHENRENRDYRQGAAYPFRIRNNPLPD